MKDNDILFHIIIGLSLLDLQISIWLRYEKSYIKPNQIPKQYLKDKICYMSFEIYTQGEWLQIDTSFTNSIITNDDWIMTQSCSDTTPISIDIQTCSQNQQQYIQLQKFKEKIRKEYNYKHFQVQIIFDFFYDDASSSDSWFMANYSSGSTNEKLYYDKYDDDDLYHNSNRICNGLSNYDFRYYTNVSNRVENNAHSFTITFCLVPANSIQKIGIRNLLVYINQCYPTCLTCDGEDSDDCDSCFDSISPSSDDECTCKSDQQFAQTSIGCRQECDRDFYIARSDKICVPDRRISTLLTYFHASISNDIQPFYSPFLFIEDKFNLRDSQLSYFTCNSNYVVGKLQNNEGMQLQLNLQDQVKFLRIRMTFYFFSITSNSQIYLQLDDIIQLKLQKSSSGYNKENLLIIYEYNLSCNSQSYTKIRVETILFIPHKNPILKIQGVFLQPTEKWGFNNFTIDQGFCQENCKICQDFSICQECLPSYILYKNQCIQSCPIHSSDCVDYEDIIPYSKYLAKGFYDFNMTNSQISKFYTSDNDDYNFKTGKKFSFFPDKIVLGGVLVWQNFTYKKNWTIDEPHYAISLRFNFTFGDGYPGQFTYKINTTSFGPISKPAGGQNLVGKPDLETTVFQHQYYPYSGQYLSIEFKCSLTTSDIRDSFCAISEYFLVVHYCQPFCKSCSSLTNCIEWYSGYSSSECQIGKYLSYNENSNSYSCKSCKTECKTCISKETCTECKDNTFNLLNDMCLCQKYSYLFVDTCLPCDKYCLSCYGPGNNNCLTCNYNHHRAFNKNQCICEPGYYDDGTQIECKTYLCGDMILQLGEECDDGNFNPFDGCHECKLTCELNCLNCLNGVCLQCKEGYELNFNQCFPTCHDSILSLPEQCDTELSNCVNCKLICPDNCNICEFGVCQQCNESQGWYLSNDGQCNFLCGDMIITKLEQCDDGNTEINDGCFNCQNYCGQNCDVCVQQKCQICKQGYSEIGGRCFSQCNDNIQVSTEICEDNNETPYDGCFFCQYSCTLNCAVCQFGKCEKCNDGWYLQDDGTCKSICGDKLVVTLTEYCDDNNINPFDGCDQCTLTCNQNCELCDYGLCTLCKQGYTLDFYKNECNLQCQYGYELNEQCDQLNQECQKCKYICQESCTLCTKDGCKECNTLGWEFNQIYSICQPICGDGIVINGFEECDDLIHQDCQECQIKCQEECNFCVKGKCQQCKVGWYLNLDQSCSVIHGDNVVIEQYEQCDDSNQFQYDGCYQGKYQCEQQCLICSRGSCLKCDNGYYIQNGKCKQIINDGIIVGSELCDDNNFISEDGCFIGRYDCPRNCLLCVKGQCLDCSLSSGYGFVDVYQNKCKSICGDKIITYEEQCDDGNTSPYDGCFQCKYQCDYDCEQCDEGICKQCNYGFKLNKKKNQCLSYCGDGAVTRYEQCDDANKIVDDGCADCKYKCSEQCLNCVEGKCYQCQGLGWQINLVSNECQPYCGDGIVVGNEQCDDANDISEDGCNECYYECQKVCTLCEEGYCQECNTFGWQLIYNRCEPICGDKIIVGQEECDDGNIIPYDGCYECKYQCQEQCTDCQKGICYACDNKGWEIIDNQCYAKCGDGYVVEGLEECDDGNSIQFDGCYNCLYQCEEMCTSCLEGICYECNQLGWTIENNVCLPLCGDGIIVGYEQCDDMNDDSNDGCHQCMNACDQYCLDCQKGVCLECELGRFVYQSICQAQCGDGYYVKSAEQCDDSNLDQSDGCDNKCMIEKDWTCNNLEGSFSVCFYSIQPDFALTLLSINPEDFEEVEVTFNQKIKLSNSVSNGLQYLFQPSIINLNISEYQIITNFSQQLDQNEIKDLIIHIRIHFFVPINQPILQVEFIDNPIVSEYHLPLLKSTNTLELQTPMVLSESQKEVALSAQAFNEAVIYSLVGVSSLCVLSGSSEIFWNLMDQLQYLSYIKYINIQFPSNLNMYFDVFKLITISPLMQFFGIDQIFESLDGDTKFIVETKHKFQKDEINGYFFLNFQSFLFCLISAYLGYWSTKFSYKLLYKIGAYNFSQLPLFIAKKLFSLRQILHEKANLFHFNGILRILLSNTYDITFACAIQMSNYPILNNFTLQLNYLASFVIYIGQFGSTLFIINVLSNFSKSNSLKDKTLYNALFEGVKQTSDVWKIQHNTVQMIKKQIFISLIVFMQNDGQIQTLCIAFVQTVFLSYLLIKKPLTNKFEYYKNIVTEILIIFNTITFLIYGHKEELQLSLEGQINLGWLHIITSTSILGVSLIIDLYQQFQVLADKIKSTIQKPKKNDRIELFI